MGEDLGEGYARRVKINESTTLSPSPSPSERVASAFTLAEVLITLVIIGIIAAITVPTLITKYQKEQTVVRLKKAYSALAQTTARAIADNGPMSTWEFENNEFADKYLIPYLNVSRDCGFDTETPVCIHEHKNLTTGVSSYMGNTARRFYLNDGTFIAVVIGRAVNQTHTYEDGSQVKYDRTYAGLWIDINGKKKPNQTGKDVFEIRYEIMSTLPELKSQVGKFLSPDSTSMTRDEALNHPQWGCNKNGGNGEYCVQVIMEDGWRIADDYPW